MNNKLLARIVAVASCVTMLGTVAFAADPAITEKTENDATSTYLSFLVGTDNADITVNENEDQITMMAYIVDGDSTLDDETTADVDEFPAYVDQTTTPMIALDQVGGSAGFGEIKVDESKLVEGKKIAVKLGCSSGAVTEFLIGYNEETQEPEVMLGDVDGTEELDIMDALYVLYYSVGDTDAILADDVTPFWSDEDETVVLKYADVDLTEEVDIMDALYLLYYSVGDTDAILADGVEPFWPTEE